VKNMGSILAASLAALALAACNTVAGAGEDIEAGGEAITEAAEDVQEDLSDN
jgi:entericidin B